VSRACPSLTNEDFIRYHLPQERGWAYIHEYLLSQGGDMRWPQSQDNAEGRWWQRILKSLKS
jgi:hypothetical protein